MKDNTWSCVNLREQIKIADGCEYMLGTIIHEMMHTLGFWHEQSRGDRDEHVTIVWENILPGESSGGFSQLFTFSTDGWPRKNAIVENKFQIVKLIEY